MLLVPLLISCATMNDAQLDSTATNIASYAKLSEENAQIFKDTFIQCYKENKIEVFYDSLERCYYISPKGFKNTFAFFSFTIDSKGKIQNKLEGQYYDNDWLYVDKVVFYNSQYKWTKSNLYWSIKSDVKSNAYVTEEFSVLLKTSDATNLAKMVNDNYSIRFYGLYDDYETVYLTDKLRSSQQAVVYLQMLLSAK